jgi:hypothetical protein
LEKLRKLLGGYDDIWCAPYWLAIIHRPYCIGQTLPTFE